MANETQVPRKLTAEEAIVLLAQAQRSNAVEVAAARLAYFETLVADVAKKISPIDNDPLTWHGDDLVCSWCGTTWCVPKKRGYYPGDYLAEAVHPEADCVYVRLMAAVKE